MADTPTAQTRTSFEAQAIASLRDAIGDRVSVEPVSGMGGLNRVAPESWELKVMQRFQFGDLRYETNKVRVIVEVESGGGLTNLVKYWPMLGEELKDRRFVFAHLFMVSSEFDYIAHRRLWEYVVERMRGELDQRGCRWERDWHARMFTYGHASAPTGIDDAATYIANALSGDPAQQ
jgi:hypothetical protein